MTCRRFTRPRGPCGQRRGCLRGLNAAFDKAIWNRAAVEFPLLQPCHIIDVMAQVRRLWLPPDLSGAAKVVGTEHSGDKRGAELIKLVLCTARAGMLADPRVAKRNGSNSSITPKLTGGAARGLSAPGNCHCRVARVLGDGDDQRAWRKD